MNLPDNLILPDYSQSTIANMPPTLAKWFDVPFDGLPPLRADLWQPVAGDVKNVVVILIDALGWNIIERLRPEIDCLTSADISAPITSVFPSTTANALSSVWTGTAPAQHGLVGFKLFLSEFSTVGQMIGLSPAFMGIGPRDIFAKAGMQPEKFLATAGSAEQFSAGGITVHDFKGREIVHSALSKMHGRGVAERHGAITYTDMLAAAHDVLESAETPTYLHLYWPTIDMLSHRRGPFGDATLQEARMLLGELETTLLNGLSPSAREGTLVCLMADHGHTTYDKTQRAILLSEHPELQEMLLMGPSGGVRFPYLFAKQGKVQAVIDYINEGALSDLATAITSDRAIEMGLFGPPPFAPKARDRMGDVILLMHDEAILLEPMEEDVVMREIVAGHGGLSSAEMHAPWIVWRLG